MLLFARRALREPYIVFKNKPVTPLSFPDEMHPNYLWCPSRSTTAMLSPLVVVLAFGGSICVVNPFLLYLFEMKLASANATRSSSTNGAAFCEDAINPLYVVRKWNLKFSIIYVYYARSKIQNPLSSTSNVHVQLPPQSNCQSLSRSSIDLT